MVSIILSPIAIPIAENNTSTIAGHKTVAIITPLTSSSSEWPVKCITILDMIPPSTKYNTTQPLNISIFISVSNVAASSFCDHTARLISPFFLCSLRALCLLLHEMTYTQGTLNGSLDIFSRSLYTVKFAFL